MTPHFDLRDDVQAAIQEGALYEIVTSESTINFSWNLRRTRTRDRQQCFQNGQWRDTGVLGDWYFIDAVNAPTGRPTVNSWNTVEHRQLLSARCNSEGIQAALDWANAPDRIGATRIPRITDNFSLTDASYFGMILTNPIEDRNYLPFRSIQTLYSGFASTNEISFYDLVGSCELNIDCVNHSDYSHNIGNAAVNNQMDSRSSTTPDEIERFGANYSANGWISSGNHMRFSRDNIWHNFWIDLWRPHATVNTPNSWAWGTGVPWNQNWQSPRSHPHSAHRTQIRFHTDGTPIAPHPSEGNPFVDANDWWRFESRDGNLGINFPFETITNFEGSGEYITRVPFERTLNNEHTRFRTRASWATDFEIPHMVNLQWIFDGAIRSFSPPQIIGTELTIPEGCVPLDRDFGDYGNCSVSSNCASGIHDWVYLTVDGKWTEQLTRGRFCECCGLEDIEYYQLEWEERNQVPDGGRDITYDRRRNQYVIITGTNNPDCDFTSWGRNLSNQTEFNPDGVSNTNGTLRGTDQDTSVHHRTCRICNHRETQYHTGYVWSPWQDIHRNVARRGNANFQVQDGYHYSWRRCTTASCNRYEWREEPHVFSAWGRTTSNQTVSQAGVARGTNHDGSFHYSHCLTSSCNRRVQQSHSFGAWGHAFGSSSTGSDQDASGHYRSCSVSTCARREIQSHSFSAWGRTVSGGQDHDTSLHYRTCFTSTCSRRESQAHTGWTWGSISHSATGGGQCRRTCSTCGRVETQNHPWGGWGGWFDNGVANHRRNRSCNACGQQDWELQAHNDNIQGSWRQGNASQHDRDRNCNVCNRLIRVEWQAHNDAGIGSWRQGDTSSHDRDRNCTICGRIAVRVEREAHNRNTKGSWQSTSGTQHCRTQHCSVCGRQMENECGGHTFANAGSGSNTGCTSFTENCTIGCGQSQTRWNSHNSVDSGNYAATCTETGWRDARQCTRCSTWTAWGSLVPALGHNCVSANISSTCTTAGRTGRTVCSRCGVVCNAGSAASLAPHNRYVTVGTDGCQARCRDCNTTWTGNNHANMTVGSTCTFSVGSSQGQRCGFVR
ncbi:MAG: hypothetical protein LBD23_16220 [Oscillospiraceae bacterium]|nr:hypothetical protein [Oscillospiraceae bacterium]